MGWNQALPLALEERGQREVELFHQVHVQAQVQRLALQPLLQSRRPSPRNQGHPSLTREVQRSRPCPLVQLDLSQEVLHQRNLERLEKEVLDLASRAYVFE